MLYNPATSRLPTDMFRLRLSDDWHCPPSTLQHARSHTCSRHTCPRSRPCCTRSSLSSLSSSAQCRWVLGHTRLMMVSRLARQRTRRCTLWYVTTLPSQFSVADVHLFSSTPPCPSSSCTNSLARLSQVSPMTRMKSRSSAT